jgi:hypothetical protein
MICKRRAILATRIVGLRDCETAARERKRPKSDAARQVSRASRFLGHETLQLVFHYLHRNQRDVARGLRMTAASSPQYPGRAWQRYRA